MSGMPDNAPEFPLGAEEIHSLEDISEKAILQELYRLMTNRKRPAVALGALKEAMKLKGMVEAVGGNGSESDTDLLEDLIEGVKRTKAKGKVVDD